MIIWVENVVLNRTFVDNVGHFDNPCGGQSSESQSFSLTLKMTIAHVVETSVNVSNKKNNRVLNWTILERKIGIWREDNTDNIIASLKMMVRRIKGFLIFDKNV